MSFYFSEKSLFCRIQYGRCVRGFWRQMPFYTLLFTIWQITLKTNQDIPYLTLKLDQLPKTRIKWKWNQQQQKRSDIRDETRKKFTIYSLIAEHQKKVTTIDEITHNLRSRSTTRKL